MKQTVDVAIVGAGPAGLAAAIVLARNGLRVVVCDKARLPIDKVCGEGVMPIGVEYLCQLDAIKHLDKADLHVFRGIQYHSPNGYVASASFAEGNGLGIRRVNLSQALLRTAMQWDGIEVIENATVRRINTTPEGTRLWLDHSHITARLLIGADGLNSRIRRWAGLEGITQRFRRLGARQHFFVRPWSDYVEVRTGRGIESYVTPCGREQVGIAFLWDQRRLPSLPGGSTLVASLLWHFPDLKQRLADAKPCSPPRGTGPLYRIALGRCADGVILIGDAGGYLDACTGEGISLALAQALCLERTIIPTLRNAWGKPLKEDLASYDDECCRITEAYYTGTRLQLFVNRYPALADLVTATLAENPYLLQHLLSANMGKTSFWPGREKVIRFLITALGFQESRRGLSGRRHCLQCVNPKGDAFFHEF